MSDADRLRATADRLEWHKDCYDPWDCCIHSVDEDGNAPDSFPPTPTDRAIAALLRAVADEVRLNPCHSGPVAAAAFALADVILGGGDE